MTQVCGFLSWDSNALNSLDIYKSKFCVWGLIHIGKHAMAITPMEKSSSFYHIILFFVCFALALQNKKRCEHGHMDVQKHTENIIIFKTILIGKMTQSNSIIVLLIKQNCFVEDGTTFANYLSYNVTLKQSDINQIIWLVTFMQYLIFSRNKHIFVISSCAFNSTQNTLYMVRGGPWHIAFVMDSTIRTKATF